MCAAKWITANKKRFALLIAIGIIVMAFGLAPIAASHATTKANTALSYSGAFLAQAGLLPLIYAHWMNSKNPKPVRGFLMTFFWIAVGLIFVFWARVLMTIASGNLA